jgi:hypothetical protein
MSIFLRLGYAVWEGMLEHTHRSLRDVKRTRCRGYNWATLSRGDINIETRPSRLGVGRKANNSALKKIYCCGIKEVKLIWKAEI